MSTKVPAGTQAAQGLIIGEMLVAALRRHGDRTAFLSDGAALSYAEVAAALGRALGLCDLMGLKRGDAIAQLSCNCAEQFILMAACYVGGFRSVTLQPRLHPVDVQAAMLAAAAPALVVYDEAFADRAAELRDRLPDVRLWRRHRSAVGEPGFWDEAASVAPAELVNRAEPEDIVRIGFTSGTTGDRPKGVLLSSRALGALTLANLADGDWPDRPVVLCAEAIAGGFGNMIVPTLMRGGTFVLVDGGGADAWFDAVERYRPSMAFLMPWSLEAIVAHPRAATLDWSGFSTIGYSGAVLRDGVMDRALSLFGPVLSQIYGQTEYPKALTILSKADHASGERRKLRSIGLPYSGTTITLLGDDGAPVADGEVGELCARGPAAFSGYLGDPEQTAHAFRDGWHHSGDLCRRDADGYLHFVDRLSDVIMRGGVRIHPSEVERRLRTLDGIVDAAAIPDGSSGRLVAVVAGAVELAAVRQRLPALFADAPGIVPDVVAQIDSLPRTLIGRLDRRAIQTAWRAGLPHVTVEISEFAGI